MFLSPLSWILLSIEAIILFTDHSVLSSSSSSSNIGSIMAPPDIVILSPSYHPFTHIVLESIGSSFEVCIPSDRITCGMTLQLVVHTSIDLQTNINIRNTLFILILDDPIQIIYNYCVENHECIKDIKSFRHYFKSRQNIIDEGYHLRKLQLVLKHVPRKHILILNINSALNRISTTLNLIKQFLLLNISTETIHNTPNKVQHFLSKNHELILCTDFMYFKSLYEYHNAGLVKYINEAAYKPIEEPVFESFSSPYSVSNCIDSNQYLSDYNSSYYGAPDVFMIGVPKGGTTSLHDLLVKDNGLLAYTKECHFFNSQFNDEGFSDYVSQFEAIKRVGKLTIDSTPAYFSTSTVLDNMVKLYSMEHLKSKKFILLLREPFSRLFSWYQHTYGECARYFICYPHRIASLIQYCNTKQETRDNTGQLVYSDTFRQFRARQGLWAGFYYEHLQRWLAVIPRSHIFIINKDTLYENQSDSLQRIYAFLGLSINTIEEERLRLPRSNDRTAHCHYCSKQELTAVRCSEYEAILDMYKKRNEGLFELINGANDKPPMEPIFPPFTTRGSFKCTHKNVP